MSTENINNKGKLTTSNQLRYKSLVDAVLPVVWMIDDEGKCLYPSKEWTHYTGQTFNQAKGSGWLKVIAKSERDNFENFLYATIKQKKVMNKTIDIWCDSQGKYNKVAVYMVPAEENEIDAIKYVCGLKECDENNCDAEKLAAVLQMVPTSILVLNLSGEVELMNRMFLEEFGWNEKCIIGKKLSRYVSDDDTERYLQSITSCLNGSVYQNSDASIRMSFKPTQDERSVVDLKLRLVVISGEVKFIVTLRKISEKINIAELLNLSVEQLQLEVLKRASQLQESNERLIELRIMYERLYDCSPDMYMSVSPDTGTVIQCNKTVVDRLHYTSKNDIIGKNIYDLYSPECHSKVKDLFEKFKSNGIIENTELIVNDCNGKNIPIELKVSAVRDNDNKILYSTSCWRDTTIEKELRYQQQQYVRLNMIYRATKIASSCDDFYESTQKMIDFICETTDWSIGHAFVVADIDNKLISSNMWCMYDEDKFNSFKKLSEQFDCCDYKSLPHQIYKDKKSILISDISGNTQDQRFPGASEMGLKSVIGFPVIVGGFVVSVYEFYSTESESMNDEYKQLFQVLGEQVGYVIERNRIEKQYDLLARFDVVTSIPNRKFFLEHLDTIILKSKADRIKFALIFIDIDNFKKINDTIGHSVGDKYLIEVTNIIKQCVHSIYDIARVGGDEFVLIISDDDPAKKSAVIAKNILRNLNETICVHGHELKLTASIGISVFPDAGSDSDTLLKHADVAMYRAKELGKNQFQYFSSELNVLYQRQVQVENNLRGAISKGEFYLVYQPLINVETGNINGVEALIRWKNKSLGTVGPQEFIPIAEDLGLISQIGMWVLENSIQELCMIKRLYADTNILDDFHMAINISACQLVSSNITTFIESLLNRYNINPSEIVLEVTETALMKNFDIAKDALNDLSRLKVGIAIDDFGTGYSSLSYLKSLPFTSLKIDQSFVRDVTTNASDAAIVETIIQMGEILNLSIIAEGVETLEQYEFLQQHDCHYAQGYYFAKPLPFNDLITLLNK